MNDVIVGANTFQRAPLPFLMYFCFDILVSPSKPDRVNVSKLYSPRIYVHNIVTCTTHIIMSSLQGRRPRDTRDTL